MASKTQREAGPGDAAGALDRLYGAPFDDFVPTRREMVAALRAGGDVAGARAVAAAAKPSRTAWALNQVARKRPELLAAALEARTKAAAAQTSGDALRASARAYRDCLAALVQAASDALREGGGELTASQGRRISATVQAIAGADDAVAREALLTGHLVADVDVDDPFAGLEAGPARERPETRSPREAALPARHGVKRSSEDVSTLEKAREREKQAREREKLAQEREQERQAAELEKARAKVAALEDEARQARVAAREAEVAAGRARAEAERLRRAVEAVEKRLSDAKGELRSRS